MIALDFDGVVANYGDHTTQLRFNDSLFSLLPHPQAVAICSNQGGMAFSGRNLTKYPSPERVAERLIAGSKFLAYHGYPVTSLLIATFHPKADEMEIDRATRLLHQQMRQSKLNFYVWAWESVRKPSPFMLNFCKATAFYGDSPEDQAAALAAGISFVLVPRFI